MSWIRMTFAVIAVLLIATGALAQQNAAPIELARLSTGAIVSFTSSAQGDWGVEIKGGDTPSLIQSKPARIEAYRSEADIQKLSAAYTTIKKNADGVIARAEIADGSAQFHFQDRWTAAGQVVSLQRSVSVSGNAPGGFYSAFLFASSPSVGSIDYFIPAGTYRGRGGSTNATPLSYTFREENPAAPMIGMIFRNGASIAMLNPTPRGETTFEDVNPHRTSSVLIDDRLRFGILNSTPAANGGFELGCWYPGSHPGPTAGVQAEVDPAVNPAAGGGRGRGGRGGVQGGDGNLLRRYRPIQDGMSQDYALAFRFADGETFAAFERNSWRWAWDVLKPAVTKLDVELVRRTLIDHLADRVTTIDGRSGIPWIFQTTSGLVWHRPDDMRVAMGFVAKNIEAADQLLREAERDKSTRGQRFRELGLAIIDSFIRLVPMSPNPAGDGFDLPTGKPTVSFPQTPWRPGAKSELFLRTISEDMVQLMRAYRREKKLGRDHPDWIKWAQQYVDWLMPQQRGDGSFPRSWQPGTTTVVNPSGSGSYNPVPLLVIMSQEIGPNGKKYLEAAIKAAQFAWDNYGDRGYFQGGTLDQPNVIDKEAGMLALEAFLALYEATNDSVWLDRAKVAADYAETYIKIWNVPVPVDAIDGEIDWKKGVPTTGLQGVSAGGGAGGGGDEFMDWSTPAYAKLYKYTGDKHYLDVARILLHDTKAMLALPGRTYDLAGPGWQQEHWGNRGFTYHRAWLPWVSTNHLWSITGLEEAGADLFQEVAGSSDATGAAARATPAESSRPRAFVASSTLKPFVRRANSRTPADTSTIRGANYCYAEFGGHAGMWNNYSPAITERDLTYAQRLGINQIRCFITHQAYVNNPEQFRQNLLHLVRAADARGIGVMPVIGYNGQMLAEGHPGAEDWARFLVDTLRQEPGLAFWDVSNEPDYPATPTARVKTRIAFARHMASVFHTLDGQTPVTIGCAFEPTMEECSDDVDVLVFHNYLRTRGSIRANIDRAMKFAASVGKQVIDDEMGCLGRANPYDVTIQEHRDAGIGWYLWELMIVEDANGRGWGNIHGIFYPDGTVRDPSIPMAVMGIFRNRGPDVVLEEPDREGRVKLEIKNAREWLGSPSADWDAGLDLAETAANLLESAQLVPMREPPTRQVELLRRGQPDMPALRALIEKYIATLQPYAR